MRWLLVSALAMLGVVGGTKAVNNITPDPVVVTTTTVPVTTTTIVATTSTTITPTTTTTLPDMSGVDFTELARSKWGKCGEWHDLAMSVGWPESEWPMINKVIWRESRCTPSALNGKDPNGGSTGLMQINKYWCKPSRYTANGWLQDQGVLSTCDELYEPETNLRAGLHIFTYSLLRNKNGWSPWSTATP